MPEGLIPTPEEREEKERRLREREQHQRDKLQFWFNIVIAVATAANCGIVLYQNRIMSNTLELTSRLVRGQDAAFFSPSFTVSMSDGSVDISFGNQGKIIASDLNAVLIISRKMLPDMKSIGEPKTARITRGQIQPNKQAAGQTVLIDGYTQDDRFRIEHALEVIAVEGEFSYHNGFENVRETVCSLYVDLRSVGGSSGVMPCEDAKSNISLAKKRQSGSPP
jgi:hypothetical protein